MFVILIGSKIVMIRRLLWNSFLRVTKERLKNEISSIENFKILSSYLVGSNVVDIVEQN